MYRVWAIAWLFLIALISGCERDRPQKAGNTSRLQLVQPETVQGCYTVSLSPWRPALPLDGDQKFVTPPPVIQLFPTRGEKGFEVDGFVVRPMKGTPGSIHSSSYWEPTDPDSIEITWTTGFSGLVMNLKIKAQDLYGTAETFWDFPRTRQTADVVARKIECRK